MRRIHSSQQSTSGVSLAINLLKKAALKHRRTYAARLYRSSELQGDGCQLSFEVGIYGRFFHTQVTRFLVLKTRRDPSEVSSSATRELLKGPLGPLEKIQLYLE